MRTRPGARYVLFVGVLVGACQQCQDDDPEPLSIDVTHCLRVVVSGGCQPSPDQPLALSIAEVWPGDRFEVRNEEGALPFTESQRAGIRRLELIVPPSRELIVRQVRAEGSRQTRIHLIPPLATDARLEAALLALTRNELEEAERLASEPRDEEGSLLDARFLGVRARVHLRRGERDEALSLFDRSFRMLIEEGELSLATFDALAQTFALGTDARIGEGLAVLDALAPSLEHWREGRARANYHRALVISRRGDLRAALHLLREARRTAEALGLEDVWRASTEVEARLLAEAGGFEEAARLMSSLEHVAADECARMSFDLNLGWQRLLRIQTLDPLLSPGAAEVDAKSPLERARSVVARCGTMEQRASVELQLGLDSLLRGNAEQALLHARAVHDIEQQHPFPEIGRWLPDIEGRAFLLQGEPRSALASFDALQQRAERTDDASSSRRAALGRGRALEALGRHHDAIDSYRAAERALDEEIERHPLEMGRASFAGGRFESARRLIDLLIRRDMTADALEVARHARARALGALAVRARIETLQEDERQRFQDAIAEFQRARRSREAAAQSAWMQPEGQATDGERERAESASLDRALALVAPREHGLPTLDPADAYLLVTGGIDSWIVFVAREDRVSASRLAPGAPEEVIHRALIASRPQWQDARTLILAIGGALGSIDAHMVEVDGEPLASLVPVRYALDVVPRHSSRSAVANGLLVIDPRSDLPGARAEGGALRHLQAPRFTVLEPLTASRSAFLRAIESTDALHFAGHGEVSENGVASALLLSDQERWMAGDTLSLSSVPKVAFLSSCEGAAEVRPTEVLGLGVAQSFVLGGSERVLASTRPLDDREAVPMATAIWRRIGEAEPPERAFQLALREAPDRARSFAALRIYGP